MQTYLRRKKNSRRLKNMNETGILSYEVALSKMQDVNRINEKKRILNSEQSEGIKKFVVQRIVHNITDRYYAYGGT
jgi:hypothetical protein